MPFGPAADMWSAMSERPLSEYRVEKKRAAAELTLTTGAIVKGHFFLWDASQSHAGPERVADLLNESLGFFPFELEDGQTALYNRTQVVKVRLPGNSGEPRLEPGYEVATRRVVAMLLSTGDRVSGIVSVFRPQGRDRLSDYARSDEVFRYVEADEQTWIVNSFHLVEIRELPCRERHVTPEPARRDQRR
jgi:hypothetical protein